MISLNNVSSAGHALHYFSQDNYYTQHQGLENSEWFGNGAKQLNLSGQIKQHDFFAVLEGKVEGQELGKWVKDEATGERILDHRPGTDMTFSAPKSVSLLSEIYGSRDVRQAHEAAVKKALAYVESNFAKTRQTEKGQTGLVDTGNLTVAMFRHNTSRDLDPQTHTHAVIMNVTKRDDGWWRSLSNEKLYGEQRLINAIYTSELANRLQALGYELRRVDDQGNFEIEGITREQIEHFSQRRNEIQEALKAKGVEIDNASAQQKEDAALKTRARKVSVDHNVLLNEWKTRAKEIGIDFEAIQAKAHARRKGGVVRQDKLTGRQAVEFATSHLVEREAIIVKEKVLSLAVEHGIGRVSVSEVRSAFDKLEKDGHLINLGDGYTTRKMLNSEKWALNQMLLEKEKTARIMTPEEVSVRIARAEGRQGFQYSEGQREALTKVLASNDRYVAVQGLAGTGKTTMLKSLREMAQEQGYTVRGMAPTGAASKVLARETGIATDTVSMFQIKEQELQKEIAAAKENATDFARAPEIWIVDESSFLSQRQKARLDHMAEKAGAKLVYLGDILQLQGVEAGKPFELAQKHGIETAYMTEINRQKTEDLKKAVDIITGRDQLKTGGRLTKLELVNNARAFAYLDKAGMVNEIKNETQLIEKVVNDVLSLGKTERERTIVITPYNEDRRAINDGVRTGLKAQGELSPIETQHEILVSKGWTRAMLKEAQYYKKGDVVRFGRNYRQIDAQKGEYMRVTSINAEAGIVMLQKENGDSIAWQPKKHNTIEVYEGESRGLSQGDLIRMTRNEEQFKNGEIARVKEISGNQATLEVRQGNETAVHQVDLSRSRHWDHAYASTVHASQGSTQYRAIFHINVRETRSPQAEENMAKVFGNRSFYVGATRASHEIRIYTNDKTRAAEAVSGKQDKTSAVELLRQERDSFSQSKNVSLAR